MTIEQIKTKITEGGRVVIPVEYRRALQLEVGDEILITLNNGEITIVSRKEALKRAQEIVNRYCSSSSLADELIAQRRQEVQNE
jgi:AbrB family looped-hinge helix DNA binding protein